MPEEIVGRGWAFPIGIGAQGGMALASARSEIDQSIHIILSTAIGERVMRPTFGSRLHELVFAPCSEQTMALASQYAEEALAMWEPRLEITEITTVADAARNGRILINIQYEIKATSDRRSLVYPFYIIPEEV